MITSVETTLWMPPCDPLVAPLGMVEVIPGDILWPEDHYWKLVEMVQKMVDMSSISLRQLDKFVFHELEQRAFMVGYRRLKLAGEDLVDHLADNLRAVGALISEPVPIVMPTSFDTPCKPIAIDEWIRMAGRLLPAKVA